MVVAIAAAVVVVRRGDHDKPAPKEPEKPVPAALAPLIDKQVLATDVVKLEHRATDPVVENGQAVGVRIKDEALARQLGLEPDDTLTSLSGRSLARDMDVYDAIFNVAMMEGTTMYVEIKRGTQTTLIRWRIDGDLRKARYAAMGSSSTGGLSFNPGSYSITPPPPPPPDPADPFLDAIEKVDDTHVKMPRKTAQHIFDNPMAMMKGARVVPAIKNGQANGFKLYAIRPSSVFAKLGLTNGDTIESINGTQLTSADKALEVYTKLQKVGEVTVDITRRGTPMRITIMITK